jgi:hypothetical protein
LQAYVWLAAYDQAVGHIDSCWQLSHWLKISAQQLGKHVLKEKLLVHDLLKHHLTQDGAVAVGVAQAVIAAVPRWYKDDNIWNAMNRHFEVCFQQTVSLFCLFSAAA